MKEEVTSISKTRESYPHSEKCHALRGKIFQKTLSGGSRGGI